MLDRERSRGLRARVGFHIRAETFLASIADGGIEVGRRYVDDEYSWERIEQKVEGLLVRTG